MSVSASRDDVPAVVDRVDRDASGQELAVLLVGDGEHEHVVPADEAGGLAADGARLRVDLDAGGNVVAVRDDPDARADAERRRAQRDNRRQTIAERRPSTRRRD